MAKRVDQTISDLPVEDKALLAFVTRELAPIVRRLRESNNELAVTDLTALEELIEDAQAAADAAQASATAAAAAATAAAAAAATAQAAADAAQDDADIRAAVLSYSHPPQPSGSSATRHMWLGFFNANWGSTHHYPWAIIPAAGTISLLAARHVASSPPDPGGNTLTYEVLKSTTGGSTFSVTSVSVTISADSSSASTDTTNSFSVAAGDCVGIRFTCDGAISNMPSVPDGGHWASVIYMRT